MKNALFLNIFLFLTKYLSAVDDLKIIIILKDVLNGVQTP